MRCDYGVSLALAKLDDSTLQAVSEERSNAGTICKNSIAEYF